MIGNKQDGTLCPRKAGERGYLLLGLLFLFALILISLAVAAPKIAQEIQRQNEIETVHRGDQYKRAIQLYYRKFGTYPTSMKQLEKTNGIRFLRQNYVDPVTGKKDWKPLHLGHVQMVTMGFFGKQMQVSGIPGTSGTGILAAGAAASTGTMGSSGIGSNSTSTDTDSYFDDTSSTNSTADISGSEASDSAKKKSKNTTTSKGTSSDVSSDNTANEDVDDGFGSSSMSSGLGNGGPGSTNPTNRAGGGIFGKTQGSTFGGTSDGMGGPIVGVTVPLKKHSMLTYRKQSVYDKWQFVYNPQEEVASTLGAGGATSGGSTGTSTGSSPMGNSSGFGSSSGSGFGSPLNDSGGLGGDNLGGSSSSGFGGSQTGGGFGGGVGSTPSNSPSGSSF